MGNTINKRQHSESSAEVVELTQPNRTCEICIEPIISPNKLFKNRDLCSHPYCEQCIIRYIEAKLEDNMDRIPCPALQCTHSLDSVSCSEILPPPLFVKWCDALCNTFILGSDGCYCPNRDCSVIIINECGGGRNLKREVCPKCKEAFCFKCKIPWHAGFSCEDSSELIDPEDVALGELAEMNDWKRCPNCRHFVQRNEGCKMIICRCQARFCYKCGKICNERWCSCDVHNEYILGFCGILIIVALIIFSITFKLYPKR